MAKYKGFFFHKYEDFVHFRKKALPGLLERQSTTARLRICSIAADRGQEAYSLAMILTEYCSPLSNQGIEIVGVDIACDHLAKTMSSTYSQSEVQRGLSMKNLVEYFHKDETSWRVSNKLRAMVQFKTWNPLSDLRPLGQFDIVFFRDAPTCSEPSEKLQVLKAIACQMPDDGFLYLGNSWAVTGISDIFSPIQGETGVYEPVRIKAMTSIASVRGLIGQTMHSVIN